MATKKTTDQPEKSKPAGKKRVTKPKTSGATAAAKPASKAAASKSQSTRKTAAAKSKPVILDPPKLKPKTASTAAADVIDAKVISSTPVNPAAAKESEPSKAAPKQNAADTPPQNPAAGSLIRGALLIGVAVILVAIGVAIAGRFTGDQAATGATAGEFSSLKSDLDARLAQMEKAVAQFGTDSDGTANSAAVTEIATELKGLRAAVDTAEAKAKTRQEQTDQTIADLQAQLALVQENIADGTIAITGTDNPEAAAQISKYNQQLQQLIEQISTQEQINADLLARLDAIANAQTDLVATKAEVVEISEFAQEKADGAALALALSELRAAVKAGAPYAAFITQIETLSATPVSDALKEQAQLGIKPLHVLQQEFPAAARLGLKASLQAAPGDGLTAKLAAYVKSQVSARSLEEREGDDPDAVLSRAEAALGRGQVQASVDLVGQLPKDGVAAMQDWLTDAQSHLQTQAAMQRLADSLAPTN